MGRWLIVLRNRAFIRYNKKGDLWISAALYTALGLILITVILSVGMPFVNKIKDRNTILQTKNVLYEMDKLVREVELEGVGSRRPFFVDIQEGDFLVKSLDSEEKIEWSITSENKLGIESGGSVGVAGPLIEEGNLKIQSTKVGQGYKISLWLDYKNNINIESSLKQLKGRYNLIIEHRYSNEKKDYVDIREA